MDANEPGAAILSLFSDLIGRIKQTQPLRSDDKPLKGGRLYSMLALGMPVNADDFRAPWTPQGQTVAASGPAVPATPAPAAGNGTAAAPAPLDPEPARALAAAYNTSVLCTTLLAVTDDQSYQEYPSGKNLNFAWPTIIEGMQPSTAAEPDDPNVVAAVKQANTVLYLTNPDGTFSTNPTPKYQAYQNNSDAYGIAVANYAQAYALARADPTQMSIWPVASKPLQNAVTKAKDNLIAGGAQDVEGALDVLASVGHPYQQHMVAAARSAWKDWDVRLAGAVPASSPYCMILPTDWASMDPNACKGWETLTVNQQKTSSINVAHASQNSDYSWFNKASSVSGGAKVGWGFFSVSGGASHSSQAQGSQASGSQASSNFVHTDAKGLTISMQYGLCTVHRPWFVGDLFSTKGWYLKGGKSTRSAPATSTIRSRQWINSCRWCPNRCSSSGTLRSVRWNGAPSRTSCKTPTAGHRGAPRVPPTRRMPPPA